MTSPLAGDPAEPPARPRDGDGINGGDRTTDHAKVLAAQRTAKVIRMRIAGANFDTIATECGYADRSGAYRAWQRAVADVVRAPAREAVELEAARLDALQMAVWTDAMKGKLAAHDQALKVSAARVKLLGLAGAIRIDVNSADAAAEVRKVAAELLGILDGLEPGDDPA